MIHSFNSDFFCIFALYMRRGVLFDYFFSDFAVTTAILPDIQHVMSDDKVTANDSKTLRLFPTVGNAVQGLDDARFPRWEIRVNMMVF